MTLHAHTGQEGWMASAAKHTIQQKAKPDDFPRSTIAALGKTKPICIILDRPRRSDSWIPEDLDGLANQTIKGG